MITERIFTADKDDKTTLAKERNTRSIAKAISWRIVGTVDTIIISYLITGTLSLALSIGAIETVTKIALYFFHERLWNVVPWGKHKQN
ncbi:MAG: DUF2061 domain-containing protein [Flavobacteriaceae bacterium]|nr:DUF2061 domain-containing protein [Flavobacteriaceae bacterium]